MKQITTIFLMVMVLPLFSIAQNKITGTVQDSQSGEKLVGAHVRLFKSYSASVTNTKGEFNLTNVNSGEHTVIVSFLGYETLEQKITLENGNRFTFNLEPSALMQEEIIIKSTRMGENSPGTFLDINKEQIEETNIGKDMPYIMSLSPSVVVSSDAGAGVGYTSMRIRGTDITRINVTINGIPYNDPESNGVFFVNLPDFASSVDNIQIQRGVGTSTNGAAAFGASINIQTQTLNAEAYSEVSSSYGSFNTFKNNVRMGTGLIDGKWAFDARLSKITSDGFVDRASSDLKSFFVSGSYFGEHSILKLNIFSGKERTYQAWYGIPKDSLSTNRTYNPYTYKNEVDDYQQDHYQLLYSNQLSKNLNFNAALHYTHGEGFYEQYKEGRDFEDYGLTPAIINNDTVFSTNLIQRKWLKNDFYGTTYSLNYKNDKINAIIGGAYNHYDGDHYGNIIWAQCAPQIKKDHQWYFNNGLKKDFNIYGKINYQLNSIFNLYGDVQYRNINYDIEGTHDDLNDLTISESFNFFNPKTGIFAKFNDHNKAYISFAISNREPSRSNFRDADEGNSPVSEKLFDYEAGYTFQTQKAQFSVNVYYMKYNDQLVLTGKINNVGSAIMSNVDDSYRTGIEISGGTRILDNLTWDANISLSRNKINNFVEYVDNWSAPYEQISKDLGTTDISFSPNTVAGSQIKYEPIKNLNISFLSKYVSDQHIDNTSNKERKLDAYFVNDLRFNYTFKFGWFKAVDVNISINNLFNQEYETNAWVYRYYYNGVEGSMDGYFPQAGTNFMAGIKFKF
ncbi:MAG: TonB-dependent receptor [Bacteroidota bacterium]|nr:TonB-dependent receptor [Bacteroidota bacterium]